MIQNDPQIGPKWTPERPLRKWGRFGAAKGCQWAAKGRQWAAKGARMGGQRAPRGANRRPRGANGPLAHGVSDPALVLFFNRLIDIFDNWPPPLGPLAPKCPPWLQPGATFSTFGRPRTDFYRFLAVPKAIKKSTIFRPPPNRPSEVQKSTLGRPRLHFSWIFMTFGPPFFIVFQIFSPKHRKSDNHAPVPTGIRKQRSRHLKNH